MSKVKPIPEGFTTVTPYLVCSPCDEAIDFYKSAFGATEICRLASPDGDKIVHATIQIGNSMIMLGDEFPDWDCLSPESVGGSPVMIHLYVEDADSVIDSAAQAGAEVTMPAQDMFWGDRYGTINDPFGHKWSIATHIKEVSGEELERGAREIFENTTEGGA
ncbi:MAG: VOC family protein [Deltaproteobacteria bacterium]